MEAAEDTATPDVDTDVDVAEGTTNTAPNSTSKKGICIDICNNVFNNGHKAAADQMRKPWEKLVQHVGTK